MKRNRRSIHHRLALYFAATVAFVAAFAATVTTLAPVPVALAQTATPATAPVTRTPGSYTVQMGDSWISVAAHRCQRGGAASRRSTFHARQRVVDRGRDPGNSRRNCASGNYRYGYEHRRRNADWRDRRRRGNRRPDLRCAGRRVVEQHCRQVRYHQAAATGGQPSVYTVWRSVAPWGGVDYPASWHD